MVALVALGADRGRHVADKRWGEQDRGELLRRVEMGTVRCCWGWL